MKISIICAMDEKRGIGKDNKIPWHIKEDLLRLRNLTKDHVVILGRKTYDSMVWYYNKSAKPMPGKLYIVVTRDKEYKPTRDNAVIAHSLEEAIKRVGPLRHSGESRLAGRLQNLSVSFMVDRDSGHPPATQALRAGARMTMSNAEEVFIIGGGQIFQHALPLVNKLYLTIIDGDYKCDTFFPDYSEFKKVIHKESRESEGYKYKFLELERGGKYNTKL